MKTKMKPVETAKNGTNVTVVNETLKINQMIKLIKNLFNKKEKQCIIPDVSIMSCDLSREFHKCEIHRCSTYGCLNCGQYTDRIDTN